MKKRVLSMFMALALCLTLLPAPVRAAEDTPESGAIVQEEQEKAPAAESPAISEQAAENGIAAQNGGDSTVENGVAEDTPEIGATVQQEQQEEQQEAPAAEPSAILEQAAENGIAVQDSEDSTVENAVAEVTVNGSTTPYADIDAAFAAAQQADSATVKLLADVTIRHEDYSGIKLEKGNITLDLNGKTLSKSTRDDNVFYARNAVFWLSPPEATTKDEFLAALQTHARLTVQDSSADRSGKIVQPNGGPAVIVALNTILTVNGGTIENASSVDLDDDSHLKPNCAVLLSGGGKAVINGGTLRGMRGVAVTGYITKEVEGLYKDTFGIEGYNNDTYGNELTVTGGNICATSGEGLIVYEKAKKIELSGGTFTTQSNAYSIWVADTKDGEQTFKGDASSLLASGCRYENNGTECVYSEDGKGVTGNATVALRPANEYAYIDKNGNLATQANCTEITERTDDISTPGWYVVKENVTISGLNISGEVNLILCDGATLTVTSFMNVTQGSTLNLYWQSAGTGKLTAAAISVLGTVTAPAGEMKRTTGEGGTTFEKCFEHDWGYTNNGDTHTAMCKLCGKAEAAESHKYDSWAPTDANTHTGTCACGATKTEGHTLTCTPNADGLTHSTKCSVCGYTAAAESHDFNQTDNYGKKCACGAYLAAECNGQQYATLARAIEAANGADITLLTIVSENVVVDGASIKAGIILGNGKTIDDIPYPSNWVADRNGIPLTMEAGEITLKDGALAQFTGYASANNAIALKGGTLTVADTVTKIIGSVASESGQRAAIEATGGVLDLQGNTLLDGGLTMSGDAQLKNKLTAGTFTNSGSETYSVSVEGSSQYTTVFDLLETGYAFAVYNEDAPTGDVIAKDTTTRELTEDVAVIKCTHKGANNKSLFKDNTCTGCGFTCAHETIKNGVCTVCNTAMGAQDNTGKYYLNLAEAFEGVADGGTVTMLTTLTDDDTISFCCDAEGNPVEKTVTLMMNGHSLSYEGASSLNIQSGKLIIGDEATISQPARAAVPAVFVDNNEQSKDRGTLEFKGKANLTGGLLIQNWGKLEGGLKEGTIITSNGTYSVSVERSETYSNVLGLLGDGLAFAKYDENTENKAGEIVDGSVKKLTEDVIVVAHTTHTMGKDNKCACGYTCPHNDFKDGKCTICGNGCAHTDVGDDGVCRNCQTQMAVKSETGGTVTYGTDFAAAMRNATNGTKITLLADVSIPGRTGISGDNTTVTLDLNEHKITGGWLDIGSNDNPTTCTLKIIGKGSYEPPMYGGIITVDMKATLDLSEWEGGTISAINISDSSNYDATTREAAVIVGSKAGTIGKLTFGNNQLGELKKTKLSGGSFNEIWAANHQPVKLSDLLASGYALQHEDGSYVEYGTTLQGASIYNVKVVKCPHAKINEDGHCAYCNATGFVAQVTAADGSSSAYTNIAAALAAADGGTVKLLADAGEITISSPLKLNLNGKTAAKLTVTGDVTLASLLPEGYAFKSGSTWITDLTGKELTHVSMARIPIKSMDYETKMSMTYGGAGTLLVKVTKETGTGAVSFQWYKVEDGKETAVGSATTKNQFDLSAQKLSAGQHTFRFSATCDGYVKMSKDIVVTVQKATPIVVTVPTVAEREYNPDAALTGSDMTGGSVTGVDGNELAGTWSFTGTNIVPTVNNKGYQAVFTPADADNYNTVTRTITVKVTKATSVIAENPIATDLTYGQKLSDSTLTGGKVTYKTADGTEVAGTFAWKNSNIKPTAADSGRTEYDVIFTPSDKDNYNVVDTKLTITVNKAAQAPNMPQAAMAPAHSTKKVGDIILPEGWSWQEADRDKALADGVAVTATAVYTGTDKGNYETESVSITITRSECEHKNTEIINKKDATCSVEGYTGDTYCKDCGEKLDTGTTIEKKPHTAGTTATCISKAVCSVCGESFGEVDATNHVHTTVKNRREATCTQTGYTGDTYCKDCDKLLSTGKELAALGHDYKATVTKQPTTTEEGVRTYTCTRCNSSYTESIAKLPEEQHTHNYTGSITKEATCTEAGVRTYTCSCGDSYTENIPATGHSYVSKVTKAATTTEEGIMTYTCSKCGHSYTQPIAKIKSDDSNKDNGSQNQKPQTGTDNGNQNQKPQPDTDNGKDNGTSIKPYIKDDSGKEGWDVIKPQLEEAKSGDTVTVVMNGTTVVPKDVIDSIKGKDTTLVLDMGNGLSWKINGQDITEPSGDIDFGVNVGADAGKSIPVDVINNVTGERYSMNLTLAYDGEFGFTATLTVNMESKNAGLYANLFYYNEQTGELEFISAGQIDAEGNVELEFTHASDYTIVVDTRIMSDNGQADNKADETIPAPKTDDSTSKYAWNNTIIIIIGICIILIVFGAVFYVRKKSGSEEE